MLFPAGKNFQWAFMACKVISRFTLVPRDQESISVNLYFKDILNLCFKDINGKFLFLIYNHRNI